MQLTRFIFAAALATVALPPAIAKAQQASPSPTPSPIPVASPTALPYPAYGTPAPGAATQRAIPGVPAQITLQQAIDIAVAKSPVLAQARANYRLTQVQVELARTGLYPNINATANYTRGNSGGRTVTIPGNGGTTGGNGGTTGTGGNQGTTQTLGGGTSTNVGLNANLQQLIYNGGRLRAQIRQATANEVAGLYTYQRQLQTLAFNVGQAYYTALQSEASTQLAVQVVRQNEVQENLVRAQLRAGTASRVDLATAQLPTAQARVSLVRAQGTELSALAAFANSMGLSADAQVAPVNNVPSNVTAALVPIVPYNQAIARALALRPDYFSAQYAVQAAQYNVRAQRLAYFPTLSGVASYGVNSTTTNGTNFVTGNSIGAVINIPIYDQGLIRANIHQAEAQLDLAQGQLAQTEQTVELNVRQGLIGLVSAQAAMGQAQAELAKAQEILKATQAQYRAGVTTLPLLLNAQVGLTQAQVDQVNALYALRQAEETYLYALGESDTNQPLR